jgi:hypothetical protein
MLARQTLPHEPHCQLITGFHRKIEVPDQEIRVSPQDATMD